MVLDEQQEVHRIDGRRLEIKVLIEPLGVGVDGMNKHGAHSYRFGCLRGPQERIEEQSPVQALTLIPAIHGKTGKQHHANRMIGKTFGNSRRGIVTANATCSQRMVTRDNVIPAVSDVNFGGVGLLIGPSESLKPFCRDGVPHSKEERSWALASGS